MNRIVKSSSRSISSVVKATSLGKALLPPITRSRPPVQDIEDNANYEKQLIDALDKAHMVFSKGTIEGQKMSFVVLWIKKAANAELVRAVQDNDRYHEIEALRNHHASKMCVFLQRCVW